jgi:hypothetical protein
MKTILLLHDEATQPTQLLQNALPTKVPVRESEAVAGCNCDRWGHPCPGCVERPRPLPATRVIAQNARTQIAW